MCLRSNISRKDTRRAHYFANFAHRCMTVNKSKAVLQLQNVVKLQCMQRCCALFVLLISHLFYHSRWLRLWPFLTQTYIATAGKSTGQRPNLPSMSFQELAAAQNPNLPRRIQAQLPVMRNSFNRVSGPNMADQPHLPAYSSEPATASFPSGGLDHHRRLLAPNQEAGMPHVASVNSLQPSLVSSSTKSSLMPSVASWLQHDQQQLPGRSQLGVGQQAGYGFGRAPGQGQSISPQGQHAQSGQAQGVYRFVFVRVRV